MRVQSAPEYMLPGAILRALCAAGDRIERKSMWTDPETSDLVAQRGTVGSDDAAGWSDLCRRPNQQLPYFWIQKRFAYPAAQAKIFCGTQWPLRLFDLFVPST